MVRKYALDGQEPKMMQVFCGIALCVAVAASAVAEEEQAAADSLKGGEMIKITREKITEFYIDKYEVTNEEYATFLTEKGNAKVEGMYWVELGSRYTALEEGGRRVQGQRRVCAASGHRGVVGTGRWPIASGRASACRRRRNGNSPARERKG